MIIVNFIGNEVEKYIRGLDQYDRGQILCISGLDLPKFVEVQFSLQETGGLAERIVGITTDGVTEVEIPNYMLTNNDATSDYEIYAFVYVTNETSAETVYKITMEVNSRPKPNPYDTPEDIGMFNRVIEVMKDSVTAAENAAGTSEKNAQKTGEDRKAIEEMVGTITGIEQQVQDVKEYAGQAKTAAEKALLSEQESKKSEEASLQHRTGAETAENNAELAEQNAKKSEQAVEQAKQLVMQMGQQVLQDKNQVDEKVEAFNKVVTDASDAIETAKTDAMDAVGTKGTEQVKMVSDEGAKQVKAVEGKGQEVLQSIPEDFTTQMASKLDKQQGSENKGKALVVGDDGNVVVGEVQGGDGIPIINTMSGESPLVVQDSAERVNKGFELIGKSEQLTTTGKNLLIERLSAFNTIKHYTEEEMVAYIDLPEGHETKQYTMYIELKPGKTDTVGFTAGFYGKSNMVETYSAKCLLNGKLVNSNGLINSNVGVNHHICFKPAREEFFDIYNVIYTEGKLTSLLYEPYTGGKPSPSPDYPQEIKNVGKWNEEKQKYDVDVKVTGKNLINEKSLKNFENYTKQGSTYYIYRIRGLINGVQYTLSRGDVASGNKMIFGISVNGQIYDNSSFLVYDGLGSSYNRKSITWTQNNVDYADILFSYNANQSQTTAERLKELFDRIEYIQLEYGNSPTAHEVIKKSQSVMLTSDRPVTKWDKLVEQDGQIGWLYQSTVKEYQGETALSLYENGFYFLVPDKKIYNGEGYCEELLEYSPRETKPVINFAMSTNSYAYTLNTQEIYGSTVMDIKEYLKTHPLHIAYKTEKSEFVPLPQAEQDAIRALKTYYPTTVITVDGGEVNPDIEVSYIADTKNYIDQKIASVVKTVVETQKALL